MTDNNIKPPETIWRPLTGLPKGAEHWTLPGYDDLVGELHSHINTITDKNLDRRLLDNWLAQRQREFAIETGQIEGLYTLKRGVTEQLITEGFNSVVGAHTIEGIDDATIKGLLEDQSEAIEMIFKDIKNDKPLTHYVIKSWHQLLTRHQATVTGLRIVNNQVERVQVPFECKGQYKIHPNNPRRQDGVVHEYCPPEHTQAEMDRFFTIYTDIRKRNLPTHVEAGWLHHRFVRTHPFQDGNGRVSRQLVAYAYLARREPPPIIEAKDKDSYITALEIADQGDLKFFCDYIGRLATLQVQNLIGTSRKVLAGNTRQQHCNGGVTNNGMYYPPEI
ncbi:MAG: Fic family protein [Gammaproteobacteria bacterium]|nr:Fic family protein [Gammaproteobacteria bacterium]MCY4210626.1 Fic family protein [Gammaproteobacteria bacterium]MCY4283580.1 Fic family protein [Gammaproteobacteria bacterium]MCY4338038.1 Fic family protein [Gammaproteobacteria bacterium]